MRGKNVKRKEGGSLNEKKYLNPDFGYNRRRKPSLSSGSDSLKRNVKLGNPNQQLNAALQGFGSGYQSHFVISSKKPYTYNEQMKDVAFYAQITGKQLAAEDAAIKTWEDRNTNNANTKLSKETPMVGGRKPIPAKALSPEDKRSKGNR
jgi:hypothetical protein